MDISGSGGMSIKHMYDCKNDGEWIGGIIESVQ
jgi:hypothetical protein